MDTQRNTLQEVTVIILGDPAEPVLAAMRPGAGVRLKIGNTAAALEPELRDARALFDWQGSRAEMPVILERAPQLEWVHTRYAGLDRALFPELVESPVVVTNGSGVFSQSLGEFAMLGALWFAKDVPRLMRAKAARQWEVFDCDEVSKQTMGIVGYGDIGRAVARRAHALDMRVLALRRDVTPRAGDEFVERVFPVGELHQMLRECDSVVVAAPLTPATHHMMGAPEFAVMKRDAIVMNVGRGPVIDEAALIAALRSGQIRGAALDVFEVEPLPPESPLWEMDNVLLSAHCSDHTRDWIQDAADFFLGQLELWRVGKPLRNIVDKRAGY